LGDGGCCAAAICAHALNSLRDGDVGPLCTKPRTPVSGTGRTRRACVAGEAARAAARQAGADAARGARRRREAARRRRRRRRRRWRRYRGTPVWRLRLYWRHRGRRQRQRRRQGMRACQLRRRRRRQRRRRGMRARRGRQRRRQQRRARRRALPRERLSIRGCLGHARLLHLRAPAARASSQWPEASWWLQRGDRGMPSAPHGLGRA